MKLHWAEDDVISRPIIREYSILRKIWHWILDEWCAAEAYTFQGDFKLEYRDDLPHVVPVSRVVLHRAFTEVCDG